MLIRTILALCVALFCGCRKGSEASRTQAAPPEEARVVRVVLSTEKETERLLFSTGVLAARDQANLSVKAAGRLDDIPVDVGSIVKRGDVVAQVQKRDYELKVQQTKAAVGAARARLGLPLDGNDDGIDVKDSTIVREAKAQLDEQAKNRERIAKLAKQGILSESELESAEAAHIVAINKYEEALQETNNRKALLAQRRAELNIAEQQLADTVIRAPFDGVVQQRTASPGEYLMEGAPVATLVRVDPIRLRVEIPEREALAVRREQRIRFRVDGDTNLYSTKVDRVSPAITQDNRMLYVESDVSNDGRLKPGAFARAEIIVDEKARAVVVPKNAVATFAGVEKVFVAENGKAAERRVVTGASRGDEIEIVRGLKAGERVILDPGTMRAGQPVSISKESTSLSEHIPNG